MSDLSESKHEALLSKDSKREVDALIFEALSDTKPKTTKKIVKEILVELERVAPGHYPGYVASLSLARLQRSGSAVFKSSGQRGWLRAPPPKRGWLQAPQPKKRSPRPVKSATIASNRDGREPL